MQLPDLDAKNGLQLFLFAIMKAATLNDIKKELTGHSNKQLLELCLRLGRFKKENKELLTYLLFEAQNEEDYIRDIKSEIDLQFEEINAANLYWAKKTLRKILRNINKHIRYSGLAQTAAELLIYYCTKLNNSGIKYQESNALSNLYAAQLKKINKYIDSMHEDLQYDFKKQVEELM